MIMVGKLRDITLNRDGTQNVTVTVNSDFRQAFDDLAKGQVKVDIRRYNKQRSLDANAYAWVLIDKIAEKMHVTKTFVYQMAIRDIGGVSETVCVQEEKAERMKAWWTAKGLGWQVDEFPSKIQGCKNLILYCGSSEFDTAQMSRLIELLIQEAEGLGISTITPKEYEALLERWGKRARTEPVTT